MNEPTTERLVLVSESDVRELLALLKKEINESVSRNGKTEVSRDLGQLSHRIQDALREVREPAVLRPRPGWKWFFVQNNGAPEHADARYTFCYSTEFRMGTGEEWHLAVRPVPDSVHEALEVVAGFLKTNRAGRAVVERESI